MDDAVSRADVVQEVYAVLDVASAAFNAGDIKGWMDAVHPAIHSFQLDHFIDKSDFTGSVAEMQVAMSDGDWTTIWRDAVVEGDSACVWGEFEWPYHLGDEHHVARVASSFFLVNMDGAWKPLFSHYTMLNNSQA
jgi:ketosteroid isomerase-like protein